MSNNLIPAAALENTSKINRVRVGSNRYIVKTVTDIQAAVNYYVDLSDKHVHVKEVIFDNDELFKLANSPEKHLLSITQKDGYMRAELTPLSAIINATLQP